MTKEELQALGLTEEQQAAIFKINGLDIEKAKADTEELKQKLKNTEEQLDAATKTIGSYKDMDIESIKESAKNYKQELDTAKAKAQQEIEALKFNHLVEREIIAAKGKEVRSIKPLLDLEELQTAENKEQAVKNAIAKIKEDYSYQFEADAPAGTGGSILGGQKNKTTPEVNYGKSLGQQQAKTRETDISKYKL